MIRKIWSGRTPSAIGSVPSGPRPWVAPQIDSSAVVSSALLAPPGPKRTAAQSMNGRTTAKGVPIGPERVPLSADPVNTAIPAIRSSAPRHAASTVRASDMGRGQALPRVAAMTSAGTTVSSVRALEKSRVCQTLQYGSL